MKTEIQKLTSLLQRTFEKYAWHGPSVMETLQNITQDIANNRLNNTHSIIELVAHMTAWRDFVISRLEGNNDFKVTDELNFPVVKDWTQVFTALQQSQTKLL